MNRVTILTGEPTVIVLAEMNVLDGGVRGMREWVSSHRTECLPDADEGSPGYFGLLPHKDDVSDNELLVELAGRKCYDSFGARAGRKTNREYIAHTQEGEVPHASILYHAKMTFFFAGISRRVSHELIRNYVGADRSEEGAPSQESTRFTHHYGFFVMPPRYLEGARPHDAWLRIKFEAAMDQAYGHYLDVVDAEVTHYAHEHGHEPKGLQKKRIYEAAASFLPHQAETSFIWTTNPAAIAKLCRERTHEAADLEIQRFARKLRAVSVERWPNLFPQPWMRP